MPVFAPDSAAEFALHGATFRSYVRSEQLCAWQLTVAPGVVGQPHRPDREEVLLVTAGRLTVALDGVESQVGTGGVVLVPAGAEFRVDAGSDGATAWVTTTTGLRATTADGAVLTPPWAQ